MDHVTISSVSMCKLHILPNLNVKSSQLPSWPCHYVIRRNSSTKMSPEMILYPAQWARWIPGCFPDCSAFYTRPTVIIASTKPSPVIELRIDALLYGKLLYMRLLWLFSQRNLLKRTFTKLDICRAYHSN